MWQLVALVVLVGACGDNESGLVDAGSCPGVPDGWPALCWQTCGNGVVDDCTAPVPRGDSCIGFAPDREDCDGTALNTSCASLGFYGGTLACTSQCVPDDHECDPCAVTCVSHDRGSPTSAAISGTRIGVAFVRSLSTEPQFAILDADFSQASAFAIPSRPDLVVGVTGGWLLVRDRTIQHVSTTGLLGDPVEIWQVTDAWPRSIAFGAGGRALLVWVRGVALPEHEVWAAVLEADGTVAVAPFLLVDAATAWTASVTTDGVSFFVAVPGRVVRVSASGAVSPVGTGFPTTTPDDQVQLSWSGGVGWYIVPTDTFDRSFAAQRFDASGAKIGAGVSFTSTLPVTQLQAVGAGFVGMAREELASELSRISLVRFDSAGVQGASTEVGLSATEPLLVPRGSDAAVVWYWQRARFAQVTP